LEIQYNINAAGATELKLPQDLDRAQNEIARLKILGNHERATKMSEKYYL
jgi:hypothetical protein